MSYSPDRAVSTILFSAAHDIDTWGLVKDDFYDNIDGGYDVCGAIANGSGLSFDDWHDQPTPCSDGEDPAEHASWLVSRAASLAALRTLLAHVYPDTRPEEMGRDALIVKAGEWNDQPDRTEAQVVAKLREVATDTVKTWLVWSNDARTWWGPNGSNCTGDLWDAGRYTREQALEACGRRSWKEGKQPPEVMVAAPEDGHGEQLTVEEFRHADRWMELRVEDAVRRAIAERTTAEVSS
ncbi:DUF6197 family protein [Nonomuraea zeae]|uniref:Uncharacterized protein n=1 Tax=Nonomuraea zeae TaxID=1642303 RepID=A0A5S4H3G0_9ACTN|nr:hypothetical protein [Nonomuraea zeae]TMR39626.1 hypothetical protein ETD85_01025 [Nonomuraea zeae]